MKKIAFQTLFIALCVIFLFAGCAVRETPVDSVVSSLTASEGTSEPTATDDTPEASEPTRTIVFDTPTTIRADWVIAEGAAPIREYSDAFSLLPVYVDAYPSMQAGRLYTYDAAYRRASAAWITDFMQIWQGSAPAATAITEDGANSVMTFGSAELSASPSRLLVVVPVFDMTDAESVLQNDAVAAMLRLCGITDPVCFLRQTNDSNSRQYRIVQENPVAVVRDFVGCFSNVTVECLGERIFIYGRRLSDTLYGTYAPYVMADVVDALQETFGEVSDLRVELYYTTDEFVFYSVPRYRFYYRAADGEDYMTACDAILFDGK